MKINHLFPLAVLLTAGWLPALTPNQSAWRQAAAKVNGALNSTGSVAKQAPGSDTGKVNALAIHLDQLAERFDTLQFAFNTAMQDEGMSVEARAAFLTQAGLDLNAIHTDYVAVQSDIAANFSSVLGGDFLVASSDALNVRLNTFISSYAVQALSAGQSVIFWSCAQISNGGDN